MGKPSPPPAPDYVGAAKEQGIANDKTALSNSSLGNPNVTNPYGTQSVSYTQTGPNGDYQPNIVQSLNPQAQQTLDAQQRVQTGMANLGEQGLNQAKGILSQPFQYTGPGIQTQLDPYGQAQTSLGDYGRAQTSLGDYGSANGTLDLSGIAKMPVNAGMTGQQAIMARLQPNIDQQNAANAQRLANQGINNGSEAWDNAMRSQNQGNNDLYSQAALYGLGLDMTANQQGYNQALQSGQFGNQAQLQNFNEAVGAGQFANQGQQQNFNQAVNAGQFNNQGVAQNYNQSLGAGQFKNTAAAQALQQQLGLYNQPLNQITALMSGSQIQAPQFQQYQGSQAQAAPLFQGTQAQGQYDQQSYAQQMAGYNSMMGAVGSAFGAAGMAAGGGFFGGGKA